MKQIIILVCLAFVSCSNPVEKSLYKKWVTPTLDKTFQIEIIKDKKVIIQEVLDIKKQKFDSQKLEFDIIEKEELKSSTKLYLGQKGKKIGFLNCSNVSPNEVTIFILSLFWKEKYQYLLLFPLAEEKAIPSLKDYKIPDELGLKCFSWKKTKEILRGKDITKISKKEFITLIKKVNTQNKYKPNFSKKPTEKKQFIMLDLLRGKDIYISKQMDYELLNMGFNIFIEREKILDTFDKFRNDKDIQNILSDK